MRVFSSTQFSLMMTRWPETRSTKYVIIKYTNWLPVHLVGMEMWGTLLSNAPWYLRRHYFGCSQDLPHWSFDKITFRMKIGKDHWWNDTEKGRQGPSRKTCNSDTMSFSILTRCCRNRTRFSALGRQQPRAWATSQPRKHPGDICHSRF